MKDLTKGKPSVLILSFALPVFLANLLQLTYSIVDTRIVGTFLGENMLAAVGSTTTLSNLIIGFLLGLSNGFAIVTAQKFGAKDIKAVKKSFAAALILGVSIALIITAAGLIFLWPILKFLNIPQDLSGEASAYISVIIAGLLATFLYDMCAAVLRAIGDTITPLIILAVSVMLNVAGDIFFVVILKEGVRGAAIATVLARRLKTKYLQLYVPDSVSESVLDRILEEDAGVKHVINTIKSADILIHGMGEAFVMAKKRGVSETLIQKLKEAGAEGEALGQYFDLDGKVVYSTDSLGLMANDLATIPTVMGIAGGASKGRAILSVLRSGHDQILVTDEAAAREILTLLAKSK